MKKLQIENIDASAVSSSSIVIPPVEDFRVAGLLGSDGLPIIKHWFDFKETFLSQDMQQIRDKASVGPTSRVVRELFGIGEEYLEFTEINGVQALKTRRGTYVYPYTPTDGWTIFAVFSVDPAIASFANVSIYGFPLDQPDAVNMPSLNITGSGNVRALAGPEHDNPLVSVNVAGINENAALVTMSQGVDRGVTCRVNGTEAGRNNDEEARLAPQGSGIRVLGSDVKSAAFDGIVGEIIFCEEDVTLNPVALREIESYLMNKYGLS